MVSQAGVYISQMRELRPRERWVVPQGHGHTAAVC